MYFLWWFVIYGFNLFYQKIYFSQLQSVIHIEINFKDLFDFVYLRDVNFTNIRNIIEQFLIDKPQLILL